MTERDASSLEQEIARNGLSERTVLLFRKTIVDHYKSMGRLMPWRETRDPYRILVSEIMLQQTGVERVLKIYPAFIAAFPDVRTLGRASLHDVLRQWQGMGYNRRAIALKRAAEIIVMEHDGHVPSSRVELERLPGIGKATASAILVYAFGRREVFIETNIRRVFIHFFFSNRDDVRDREIRPLVESTLDAANPREWYYALMDYGTMIRKTIADPNRRSAHYQRQPPFAGSERQVRGLILRAMVSQQGMTAHELLRTLGLPEDRVYRNLTKLAEEGFIREEGEKYVIA
ncbi:MAG TPA: helix-turn-helix domain-containing protein [Dissulfurispiraceae bacterium]|nr:helix-turn-helix domain-containing protein [Dissulfurispiraceae bacterium]